MASKEEQFEDEMRRSVTSFNNYFFNIQKRHESQRHLLVGATSSQKGFLVKSGFLTYLDNILSCAEANQVIVSLYLTGRLLLLNLRPYFFVVNSIVKTSHYNLIW